MSDSTDDGAPKEKATSILGITRYWWIILIVIVIGYTFGKDLALTLNQADQANTVSADH